MTCPACKSEYWQELLLEGSPVAVCSDCATAFIPETRAEPFAQLCDDCAFRPGSPERADPSRWAQIVETTIVGDKPFYCHKGLTCRLDGTTLHYIIPDNGRETMTPCAGWYSRKMAYAAGRPLSKL